MRLTSFSLFCAVCLGGCATSKTPIPTKQTADNIVFSIFSGDPVYAEVTVHTDGSMTLTKVEKIGNPSTTLIFNLTKLDNSMMLSIKNPLDKAVKYHLDVIDYQGRPHNTSSCAVPAGLSVFESWSHPIPEIRVSKAHIASENEEGVCIY